MGIPVMIMGTSGAGKSTSLQHIDPSTSLLVKVVNKPLPFRSSAWQDWDSDSKTGSVITTDQSQKICSIILNAHKLGRDKVFIDDYQYLMANEFMRRSQEKGFDKFTEIARHAWDVIMAAQNAAPNVRIYFLSHTDTDDFGNIKVKTIGKLLDDKISLEGLFTIVLRACVLDNRHYFSTINNGRDTVKSPIDMFPQPEINNDLQMVDNTVCEYYGINLNQQKENAA